MDFEQICKNKVPENDLGSYGQDYATMGPIYAIIVFFSIEKASNNFGHPTSSLG